jgi:hypothetical protein
MACAPDSFRPRGNVVSAIGVKDVNDGIERDEIGAQGEAQYAVPALHTVSPHSHGSQPFITCCCGCRRVSSSSSGS